MEIELEDERKYLPTDLFIEHEKLCSTKSHNGNWTTGKWEKRGVVNPASAVAVRKTTSLNVQREDGFTLFSSDQLDLLSSVRSNWTTSSGGSSSSGGSDYGGDMTVAASGMATQECIQEPGADNNSFEDAMKNLTQGMGTMILRKM